MKQGREVGEDRSRRGLVFLVKAHKARHFRGSGPGRCGVLQGRGPLKAVTPTRPVVGVVAFRQPNRWGSLFFVFLSPMTSLALHSSTSFTVSKVSLVDAEGSFREPECIVLPISRQDRICLPDTTTLSTKKTM